MKEARHKRLHITWIHLYDKSSVKGKIIGIKFISVVSRGWEKRKEITEEHEEIWDNGNVLYLDCDGGYMITYTCKNLTNYTI